MPPLLIMHIHVNLRSVEFAHQHHTVLMCIQAYSQPTKTAQQRVKSCRRVRALTAAFQVCLHALLCFDSSMKSIKHAEPGPSLLC